MEDGGRGSAALVFPDPLGTSAGFSVGSPTPIVTFNELSTIDLAVYKIVIEWEKLHQKIPVQPPSTTTTQSSMTTSAQHTSLEGLISLTSKDQLKDRIKFVKYLSKLVPALLNSPNALNPLVAGSLLCPHWRTVGETLLICAMRRIENTFLKETKTLVMLILAELFKFGPKPGLRVLLFAVVLMELEEKEGLPVLGFAPPKLHELKTELEGAIVADIHGFLKTAPNPNAQSFSGGASKPKQLKVQSLRGVLSDSRLALYLVLGGNELQTSSEQFLLLEQLVKYTGYNILVTTCKKWREAIVKGQTNVKLSIDVCIVFVLKQLFRTGTLQTLTTRENLMLKCIFCMTLRDNYWFWDRIESLFLDYPDNLDLSPEELNLLLTLNGKLIRKLGKVCFSKTNEYKTTKLKISQHLNKSLTETILRAVKECQQDKYKSVCNGALEDLCNSFGIAVLFMKETVEQSIGTSLCTFAKVVVDTQSLKCDIDLLMVVSLCCSSKIISSELRLVCNMFFLLLQHALQPQQERPSWTSKNSFQLLKLFHRVFSVQVFRGVMLYPMLLSLALQLATLRADKKDMTESEMVWLVRIFRLLLEQAKLKPDWPLAKSAWNKSHTTLGQLCDAYEAQMIRYACQFLRLDSNLSTLKCFESVSLEVALMMRSVRNPLIVKSFQTKIDESLQRAHLGNLMYLHHVEQSQSAKTLAKFEDLIISECLGVDTLSDFLAATRSNSSQSSPLPDSDTYIQDTRTLDLYRVSQQPPKQLAGSPGDMYLSDGSTILQVCLDRKDLTLRNEKGVFEYRVDNDPHALANFLSVNGWLSQEIISFRDKKDFTHHLGLLDEKDSLIPIRVGFFVLPSRADFEESLVTNEELERLLLRKSQEPITSPELQGLIKGLIEPSAGDLQYRNNMVTNHIVRASLMVAPLYQDQKDRYFELKKELGTCEVNIYIDCEGISAAISDQFLKSGQTFVEIIATKLTEEIWSVTLKPQPSLMEELQRQRMRSNESWNSKQDNTEFGYVEFSDFWLYGLCQSVINTRLTVGTNELADVLRGLSIFYSLATKAVTGSLKNPSSVRKIKLAEICNKQALADKSKPGFDLVEMLQNLLLVTN